VHRLTPYLLLAVLTLGTGLGIGLGLAGAPAPAATARMTTRLVLNRTTATAGQPIHGTLVIENTGEPINLTKVGYLEVHGKREILGCMPGVLVALGNRHYRQNPAFAAQCEPAAFIVRHGTTKVPITISTFDSDCLQQPGGSAAPGIKPPPPCRTGPSGTQTIPPLPPGRYSTWVVWSEMVPVPQPKAVMVTIRSG